MSVEARERAYDARILVSINFHFDAGRLAILGEAIRALSQFPVALIDVLVTTNTSNNEEIGILQRLCAETLSGNKSRVLSCQGLKHPFDLAWCHKPLIMDEFLSSDNFTHFIYIEGDINFSFANFSYWNLFREYLRPFGLLPAFVRMEYSLGESGFTSSDLFWPIYVPHQAYVKIGDTLLVNLPNPYNPLFILDKELASEYANSPSFDQQGSNTVSRWGVLERSAMGLCLERVPPPFQSRYVVPVDVGNAVLASARVWHMPNNYANNPQSPLGKLRIDSIFLGATESIDLGRWDNDEYICPNYLAFFWNRSTTSLADVFYLISDHDTIVYLCEGTSRLKHAPLGIAEMNLVYEISRGGRLMIYKDGSGMQEITFASDEGTTRYRMGEDLNLEVTGYANGTISISSNGLYLGADLDGYARKNKSWCRQWERFRLVPAEKFRSIAFMKRYPWVSHHDRRVVSLADQPFYFEREDTSEFSALAATLAPGSLEFRRSLAFGPAQMSLVGGGPTIVTGEDIGNGFDVPNRLLFTNVNETVFSRLTPLIQYTVEGSNAEYECLYLSLSSLVKHGRYCGTVYIVSDRSPEEVINYVPHSLRRKLILSSLHDESTSPAKVDFNDGGFYQPIMICDSDIIFAGNIIDILIDALVAGERRILAERFAQAPQYKTESKERRGLVKFDCSCGAVRSWAMSSYLSVLDGGPERGLELALGKLPTPDDLLSGAQLSRLAGLAQRVPPNGCIVEIAPSSSLSSWTLARNAGGGVTVYCLNPSRPESWISSDNSNVVSPQESCEMMVAGVTKVIPIFGQSPRDFFGWRREIDLLVDYSALSHPDMFSLVFWSQFVRLDGVICGLCDKKSEPEPTKNAVFGSGVEVADDLWFLQKKAVTGRARDKVPER